MIKYISNNKELLDKLKELEIKNNKKINKWKEMIIWKVIMIFIDRKSVV